ncbi:hypothetical protein LPJ53_000078 [Coemansia erecta]|uniref:Uncharacterized protein n=1 Tax=Coemansia erecta TaxID=147472 RepID=A0A9W8CWE2_9FUNG|nr:hypothetical protein LPJ53_000078 [Coemansia erecta]
MCLLLNTETPEYGSERRDPFSNIVALSIFARLFRSAMRTDRTIGRRISKPARHITHRRRNPKRPTQKQRQQQQLEALRIDAIAADRGAGTEMDTCAEGSVSSRCDRAGIAPEEKAEETVEQAAGDAVVAGSTAQQIVPRAEECWPVQMLLSKYPELRFERWLPKSLRNTKRSSGAELDDRFLRGKRGYPLCLWCGKETSNAGQLFCPLRFNLRRLTTGFGEGCEHEHRMRRDNQYVRSQLQMRDRGVCCYCGTETLELYRRAAACTTLAERNKMFRELAKENPEWLKKIKRPLTSMDYKFNEGMFWEAAHRIDVKHGGGLCGLDGYNTLCVPCHNEEYMRNYMTNLSSLPMYQSPPPPPPQKQQPLVSPSQIATPMTAPQRPMAASTGKLRKNAGLPLSAPRTVQTSLHSAMKYVSPLAERHISRTGHTTPQNLFAELSRSSSGSLPSPTSNLIFGPSKAQQQHSGSSPIELISSADTSMNSKTAKRKASARISLIRISSDEYSDSGSSENDGTSEDSGIGSPLASRSRRAQKTATRGPSSTMSEYSYNSAVSTRTDVSTTNSRRSRNMFSTTTTTASNDKDTDRFANITVRRARKPATPSRR